MQAKLLIRALIAAALITQGLSLSVQAQSASSVRQASSRSSSRQPMSRSKSHKSRHRRSYGLVPPPPPTAVSPTVLAMYPVQSSMLPFLPGKRQLTLAEEMKLTAVMDDVAFFSVNSCNDGSVHLKAGNTYDTVTVAQISPDAVVLEENGQQFVKRLK